MSQYILRRVLHENLPMRFAVRADIGHLQDLRAAGYLRVTFGPPFSLGQAGSATVTEITPLGRAASRYLGF